MKYMLLIHHGTTPGSDEWESLSEDDKNAVYAAYRALNETPGFTPGVRMQPERGVWGPPALPADLILKIQGDISKVLAAPDMKEIFLREGAEAVQMTPADFARTVTSEIEQWKKVAAKAGIKPD